MSVCFDLGVGNGVVVQHGLQVGPVGREVWKEHPLYGLPTQTHTHRSMQIILTQVNSNELDLFGEHTFHPRA